MPKADLRLLFAQMADVFSAAAETVTRADLKRAVSTITKEIRTMSAELQTIINRLNENLTDARAELAEEKRFHETQAEAYRAGIAAAEAKGATPEQLQQLRDLDASWDEVRAEAKASRTAGETPTEAPADAEPEPDAPEAEPAPEPTV